MRWGRYWLGTHNWQKRSPLTSSALTKSKRKLPLKPRLLWPCLNLSWLIYYTQQVSNAQFTSHFINPQASPLSPNTTLVPVSMATILATPPKMRTPRTLQAPLATAHRTNMHRSELRGRDVDKIYFYLFLIFDVFCTAPIVLPLGVSPLVTVQRMSRLPTAERPRLPTAERPRLPVLPEEAGHRTEYTPYRTPAARKVGVTPGPPMALPPSSASPLLRPDEGVACQETDVSSPEAAHARCQAVRLDYGGVRNPATLGLREKVMRLPLQRGGLFSKGLVYFLLVPGAISLL